MRFDAIARLLPAVYQQALPGDPERDESGSVLAALLGLIGEMQGSTEAFLGDPARIVDPYRAPPDFLVALARWMALSPYLDQSSVVHADLAGLRELTRRAASLARRRGTAEALVEMCELITGVHGFRIEERVAGADGRSVPFHFRLVAPAAARSKRATIDTIVATEKPCFVTAEIVFEEAVSPTTSVPTAEEEDHV